AAKYDLKNDLMAFGIHRIWKKQTIAKSVFRKGDNVLDLAGGKGDLAYKFCQMFVQKAKVIIIDINYSMLEECKEKHTNKD
ncbi:class I SAM-dependent methyltransferase, partial [Francisella tularensis subsp. holarctica]|uniref:class I SAM-dependent methyltransferase n=1 Tax=Francisella tularensis TaxID=263 RepID=UPI002381A23F